MKHTATSILLTGALGLGGLATGIVVAPAIASAATTSTTATEAVSERVTEIREALSSLVTDGSITQAQADEVASTLAERLPDRHHGGRHDGPGGPGRGGGLRGLETAATVLGVSTEELRTALSSGQSLADVAEDEGVPTATLVAELVEAAQAHLAEHVADGSLTQAQADERAAELTERITAQVERQGLPVGPGRGGGHHDDAPSTTTEPSATPSTPS